MRKLVNGSTNTDPTIKTRYTTHMGNGHRYLLLYIVWNSYVRCHSNVLTHTHLYKLINDFIVISHLLEPIVYLSSFISLYVIWEPLDCEMTILLTIFTVPWFYAVLSSAPFQWKYKYICRVWIIFRLRVTYILQGCHVWEVSLTVTDKKMTWFRRHCHQIVDFHLSDRTLRGGGWAPISMRYFARLTLLVFTPSVKDCHFRLNERGLLSSCLLFSYRRLSSQKVKSWRFDDLTCWLWHLFLLEPCTSQRDSFLTGILSFAKGLRLYNSICTCIVYS